MFVLRSPGFGGGGKKREEPEFYQILELGFDYSALLILGTESPI